MTEVPYAMHSTDSNGQVIAVFVAPVPTQLITSDGVWHTDGTSVEARLFNAKGQLERIVRADRTPRQLSPAEVEALRDAAQRRFPPGFDASQLPPPLVRGVLPSVSKLLQDDSENLWIQHTRNPFGANPPSLIASGGRDWSVFSPEGQWLGVVTMPALFQPEVIRGDVVYGVSRDSRGVESIRGHALSRGS